MVGLTRRRNLTTFTALALRRHLNDDRAVFHGVARCPM